VGGYFAWKRSLLKEKDAATSAYESKQWDEAANLARQRLLIDRDDAEALRLLARSSARMEKDSSALNLYKRLDPKAMMAEDHYLLGLVQSRAGQLNQTKSAWNAALALDANHAEALYGLARLHAQERRFDVASDLAERLARQPGWEARGLRLLGLIRVDLNDPPGAVDALLGSLDHRDPGESTPAAGPDVRRPLARALLQTGRPDEARDQLQSLLRTGPDPALSWLLSRAELQRGAIPEAEKALADAGSYRVEHPFEFEPSPYVGEARCTRCHASIAKAMQDTRHVTSYHRGPQLETLPVPDRPIPDPGDSKIVHTMERTGAGIEVKSRIGDELHRLVVEYAFGTTGRYVTMVGRDDRGEYRASRLSYHHDGKDTGWDVSSGDQLHHSRSVDYLGKAVDAPFGIIRCLACHTTNVRFGKIRTGPETSDRGIGCERCHGPGGDHLAAVKAKFSDLAIINPARAPETTSEKLCASCHNLNDDLYERTTPREDPGWVRSPGKTMTWSRCYTETRGLLRCLTCHDAHHDSDQPPSFYEAKCLSCHAGAAKDSGAEVSSICPVNARSGCLDCHMPKVHNELLHTSLTDHYIRVHNRKTR
jgi:tetratricopeptide (TPR) repeat protein